jgi:hypothetical protein
MPRRLVTIGFYYSGDDGVLNVIKKHTRSNGIYYCVYLDELLVLQTKNVKFAAFCQAGRIQI